MADGLAERHYGMDWLRIGAFGLLIFYHVGMAFGPWPYEVKVTTPIDWVAIPMLMTSPWRLSLLFVIAGYASAALFAQRSGSDQITAFLRGRMARLGIPLLFGIAVIVVPQPWVALATQHGYPYGFGHFVLHDYYRFQFIDGIAMPTWMHLWFVLYLLVYTIILAGLLALPLTWRKAGRERVERLITGPLLLPLPIGLVFAARTWISPGWLDTHALFDDWSAHAVYLPVFLFGFLLHGSIKLHAAIGRQWKIGIVLAVLAYLGMAGLELAYPGRTPLPTQYKPFYNLLQASSMWGAVIGLIGLADRHWNHDHRWRATLAEAVFPIYIIHQTIIVVVGYWLLQTSSSALVRFAILIVTTAGWCWLFYLIGRVIQPLRPLIGLKRRTLRSV